MVNALIHFIDCFPAEGSVSALEINAQNQTTSEKLEVM